jgi:hypothetical protein
LGLAGDQAVMVKTVGLTQPSLQKPSVLTVEHGRLSNAAAVTEKVVVVVWQAGRYASRSPLAGFGDTGPKL